MILFFISLCPFKIALRINIPKCFIENILSTYRDENANFVYSFLNDSTLF